MRILFQFLTMIGLVTLAASAVAHHSFAAEFSYDLFGSREGEVVEIHFVNPHALIVFAVEKGNGEKELWDAQTLPPQNLLLAGWDRGSIKVGDRITVHGNLGLRNSPRLWIITITLENGTVIYPNAGRENY